MKLHSRTRVWSPLARLRQTQRRASLLDDVCLERMDSAGDTAGNFQVLHDAAVDKGGFVKSFLESQKVFTPYRAAAARPAGSPTVLRESVATLKHPRSISQLDSTARPQPRAAGRPSTPVLRPRRRPSSVPRSLSPRAAAADPGNPDFFHRPDLLPATGQQELPPVQPLTARRREPLASAKPTRTAKKVKRDAEAEDVDMEHVARE
jgi:hypothetical protein